MSRESGWVVAVFFVLLLVCFSITLEAETKPPGSAPDGVREMPAAPLPEHLGVSRDLRMPEILERVMDMPEKMLSMGDGLRVAVSDAEWEGMGDGACETCHETAHRVQVGIGKAVDVLFDANVCRDEAIPPEGMKWGKGALIQPENAGPAWLLRVEAPGAGGLRLYFSAFNLGEGVEVYWYSDGGAYFGPYTGSGPLDSGAFWSNTLAGDAGYVLLVAPGRDKTAGFRDSFLGINTVTALRPDFFHSEGDRRRDEDAKALGHCIEDISCYTGLDGLSAAVAFMVYQVGMDSYICSGGLINTDNTFEPYFLTANHCLSTQVVADSLECFWDFKTSGCNVGFHEYASTAGAARTLGAQLLATNAVTDFTFLLLNGPLPAARWFYGWTTAQPSHGQTLYRVSHPQGAPQSFSTQTIIGAPDITCTGLPAVNFTYSDRDIGSTEGGSSGSPVVNEGGQIVGQLYGFCSETGCGSCDTGCVFQIVDGRFSVTFPYIESWFMTSAPTGALSVTLLPAGAVTAGAQWRVGDGAWRNSGAVVSDLSVGSHTVTFKSIPFWAAPAAATVQILEGETTLHTGTYTELTSTGALTVTLLPGAAATAGAQWQVDDGGWQNSGVTVSGLSVGNHVVSFKLIAGWTAPASATVAVQEGATTHHTATYEEVLAVSLAATPSQRTISAAAGTALFDIQTTARWSVSSDQSWATIDSASGTGNRQITVTCSANTGSAREATLTITGENTTPQTVQVRVVQETAPALTVSPLSIEVDDKDGAATFAIQTTASWTANTLADWATVSSSSGTGNASLAVYYNANGGDARNATITVTGDGTNPASVQLRLYQDASRCGCGCLRSKEQSIGQALYHLLGDWMLVGLSLVALIMISKGMRGKI